MIYLDHNATSPMRPEVADLMRELEKLPLNASSIHKYGRQARQLIEGARKSIAERLGVFPNEIYFTASGTEANNWALRSMPQRKIVVSSIEHSSIDKPYAKWRISHPEMNSFHIPVLLGKGIIDLNWLALNLQGHAQTPTLVSVMLANNETGIIQPVKEVVKIARRHDVLVHTDAVQAIGKIPVNFSDLGVDMMTIAAHKMGGPKGAGALIVKQGLEIEPLLLGGGQERNMRAGTENVAAICGFAKALEMADFDHYARIDGWRRQMLKQATIVAYGEKLAGKIIDNWKDTEFLPNTAYLLMPGVSAELQLIHFDTKNIAVSAGSACSSGRLEPSRVLRAMGLKEEHAEWVIRVSAGWNTTEAEIQQFTNEWISLYQRLGKSEKSVISAAG